MTKARRFKRIFALAVAFAVAVTFMPVLGGVDYADAATKAKTVYKNGNIYTVEGKNWHKSPKKAMAVSKTGKILAVGKWSAVKKHVGKSTKVVNLKGRTVLPGFIDSHVHPPGTALTELYNINLYYAFDKASTMEIIKEYVEANPDVDVYWGSGFNMGMVDENGNPPTKEWLDEVCPDKPMILTSNDGHTDWLNSAALEACGIDRTSEPTQGGNIHKGADGEPTGLLTDTGSLITLEQEYTDEQKQVALQWFFDKMNEWGYTALSSAGAGEFNEIIIDYAKENKMPLTVNLSGRMEPSDPDGSVEALEQLKEYCGNTKDVEVLTAKFFADGVVEGVTAYLLSPYTEEAGKGDNYVSEPLWDEDVYDATLQKVAELGYQIHVHSIGDAATRMTLDGIEKAQEAAGDQDYRNVIAHTQLVSQQDKPRFGELGIIAAVQTFWHLKEPDWYDTVDELVLGKHRAYIEYPLKTLKDNGALLTASGDYPVSPVNNPFWGIEAGVTRNLNNADYYEVEDITNWNDSKWLLNKAERVSVKDMIEAYTINGAYQMYKEDQLGSLKKGKKADFVVLTNNPFKVKKIKLDEIKIQRTYKGGELVYKK